MKVLTLVPSLKGHSPGQRGSIELWERILSPAGIHLHYVAFESQKLREVLYLSGNHLNKATEMVRGYVSRLGLLTQLDEYDAVFVYREAAILGPAFLEKLIARKKPIIYQLDDPLFVPYRSPSNGYLSYLKFFGKVKEIIKISKVVMVNSTHIREYAEQFNHNIWQVPSVVDTDTFSYISPIEGNIRPCVGWSGSPTTLTNLKMLELPLQAISQADVCDIHFIGGTDFGLNGVKYSSQRWNERSEVADLRKMQIGLVPLPDNPWNRYKFIMKTAQYMALGIVPIGTPMSSNPEVIRHGENGFLADSQDEWVECISTLVADADLRNNMSKVAAMDAEAKYSLRANAEKIISAFSSAVE